MAEINVVNLDEEGRRAQERQVFLDRVDAQRSGHTGDIVSRESFGTAMAAGYPTVSDGSVPAIEQK